jgi:hypothetical protein
VLPFGGSAAPSARHLVADRACRGELTGGCSTHHGCSDRKRQGTTGDWLGGVALPWGGGGCDESRDWCCWPGTQRLRCVYVLYCTCDLSGPRAASSSQQPCSDRRSSDVLRHHLRPHLSPASAPHFLSTSHRLSIPDRTSGMPFGGLAGSRRTWTPVHRIDTALAPGQRDNILGRVNMFQNVMPLSLSDTFCCAAVAQGASSWGQARLGAGVLDASRRTAFAANFGGGGYPAGFSKISGSFSEFQGVQGEQQPSVERRTRPSTQSRRCVCAIRALDCCSTLTQQEDSTGQDRTGQE